MKWMIIIIAVLLTITIYWGYNHQNALQSALQPGELDLAAGCSADGQLCKDQTGVYQSVCTDNHYIVFACDNQICKANSLPCSDCRDNRCIMSGCTIPFPDGIFCFDDKGVHIAECYKGMATRWQCDDMCRAKYIRCTDKTVCENNVCIPGKFV